MMNTNSYQLVVFDWEGTLADTLGSILYMVSAQANKLGFGQLDFSIARKYIDLGLIQAIRKTYPNLSKMEREQLLEAVHQAMISSPGEVHLISGALEFIKQLQDAGIMLAIATNKGKNSLQRALKMAHLEDFFKVTRSAGQTPAKPCPLMLEEIMEEYGVEASATLMIGDSIADMEMATSIDVCAIGVDFYHQQAAALKAAGALMVCDDYRQIADFLGLPQL